MSGGFPDAPQSEEEETRRGHCPAAERSGPQPGHAHQPHALRRRFASRTGVSSSLNAQIRSWISSPKAGKRISGVRCLRVGLRFRFST